MDKIFLYLEGTHGNFLIRCLSVAAGLNQDFDFFQGSIGAHNTLNSVIKLPDNKFKDTKTGILYGHNFTETDIFCYISFKRQDLYILCWHMYIANMDFGLDLLKTNNFQYIKKHLMGKQKYSLYDSVKEQISMWKVQNETHLREMFKKYHTRNFLLEKQKDRLEKHKIHRVFLFEWFYNKEIFIRQLKLLLEDLGYKYCVDISHRWDDFISNKKKIIQSKEIVQYAFLCYTKNIPVNISNFCVYQQAYLDHLIEQHLGYEIELWQEYPKNTRDIKPVRAW